MFDVTAQLFWYKPLFILELLASVVLFTSRLKRRPHFALRVALSVAALLGLALAFPVVYYNAAWVSFTFLSLFAAAALAMKLCFEESRWNVLFCAVAAYTVRHFAYTVFISLNDAIFQIFDISMGIDPYNKPVLNIISRYSFITVSLYLVTYFVCYWAGYFMYARRISPREDLNLGYSKFVMLAGAIVLVDIVLSLITEYNAEIDTASLVVERIYNLLSCVLALELLFGQLRQKEIYGELDAAQQFVRELQKTYTVTKENIDTINIKCHDLKHQIRAYRQKGVIDEQELEEIEHAVTIYQSAVKTGSEALDVVLTDKSLYCEKYKIVLTCIVDGEKLAFMRPGDIYALFGNALDNAIEAVKDMPEEKRSIGFSVKSVNNTVIAHIENYFSGCLNTENGRIKTSKRDDVYHGFGLLSMKTIAEKYGGTMEAETIGDIFSLSFLFIRP